MCPPRTLAEMAAATSVHVVAIVEPIIQHADWFFPEGRFWVCSTYFQSPALFFFVGNQGLFFHQG